MEPPEIRLKKTQSTGEKKDHVMVPIHSIDYHNDNEHAGSFCP